MSNTGSTTVNFGAFPGSPQATVVITGQTGILSSSLVEAWVDGCKAATAAHSQDEHVVAELSVTCTTIVPGTGFTIAVATRQDDGAWPYGTFNVSWVWN